MAAVLSALIPESSVAFLRERGLEPADLEAVLSPLPREAGVLLVGSVAEGLANRASDLDLLVLLEDDERAGDGSALDREFAFPSQSAVEVLGQLRELEVNLETYRGESLGELGQAIHDLDALRRDPRSVPSLPVLCERDLRFWHRLRTGIPLRGFERVRRWQRDQRIDLLPSYVGVIYYITAFDYLEDAVSWVEAEPDGLTALLTGRTAVEALILSALSCFGVTHPYLKWAPRHVAALGGRADLPVVLARFDRLLFPEIGGAPAHRAYVGGVCDAARDLFEHMKLAEATRPFIPFLREYCRGRYRLDLSFLDAAD